jgi:hypothetical protein
VEESTVRAQLYQWLEGAQAWHKPEHKGDEPKLGPFKPTVNKVTNVVDSLRAVCNLPASYAAPCRLVNDPGLNPREFLAVQNGLPYIPTLKLFQVPPDFFTLNGLEFEYDSKAPALTSCRFLLRFRRTSSFAPNTPFNNHRGCCKHWFCCAINLGSPDHLRRSDPGRWLRTIRETIPVEHQLSHVYDIFLDNARSGWIVWHRRLPLANRITFNIHKPEIRRGA